MRLKQGWINNSNYLAFDGLTTKELITWRISVWAETSAPSSTQANWNFSSPCPSPLLRLKILFDCMSFFSPGLNNQTISFHLSLKVSVYLKKVEKCLLFELTFLWINFIENKIYFEIFSETQMDFFSLVSKVSFSNKQTFVYDIAFSMIF